MDLPQHVDTLIVGAGPIGLACAISATRHGRRPLVIDAGTIANSILRYPIGMVFFTTPERLEIGNHPLTCSAAKPTREEALKYYRSVARAEQLDIRPNTRFAGAERVGGAFLCGVTTQSGNHLIRAERLVIATGYFEHPNLLGVPGEYLPHVSHWFDEPHRTTGLDIVVIGGKNSAVETALLCFRAGARVTMLYRGDTFKPSIKFWLRPDIDNRVAAGEITLRLGTTVKEITTTSVAIEGSSGHPLHIPAQRVYALTGYHPNFEMLASLGLLLDGDGRPALDPETLESNVPGLFVAGSAGAGRKTGDVFIENGRWDGEKIFGERGRPTPGSSESPRPLGE